MSTVQALVDALTNAGVNKDRAASAAKADVAFIDTLPEEVRGKALELLMSAAAHAGDADAYLADLDAISVILAGAQSR